MPMTMTSESKLIEPMIVGGIVANIEQRRFHVNWSYDCSIALLLPPRYPPPASTQRPFWPPHAYRVTAKSEQHSVLGEKDDNNKMVLYSSYTSQRGL